jgi:Tfp pilus assembly protein PilF
MNPANERVLTAFLRDQVTWAELEGMTADEAEAIAKVACDLAAEDRLHEAKVLLEGLVAGNPKDCAARAALGTVYQRLGENQLALDEYNAALELYAEHPVALANRGELRLLQKEEGAVDDLRRAVAADPDKTTAAASRAELLLNAITLAKSQEVKPQAP